MDFRNLISTSTDTFERIAASVLGNSSNGEHSATSPEFVDPAAHALGDREPRLNLSQEMVDVAFEAIITDHPRMEASAREFAAAFDAIGYNYVHVDSVASTNDRLTVVPEDLKEFERMLKGNDKLHRDMTDVQTAMPSGVETKSKDKSVKISDQKTESGLDVEALKAAVAQHAKSSDHGSHTDHFSEDALTVG